MTARKVTTNDFERDVIHADVPTLVDFYADWCGPCRAMGSVVDELASSTGEAANVVKVNIDDSPELAQQYGVQSIPTFVVVRDGQPTAKLVGVQSKEALAEGSGWMMPAIECDGKFAWATARVRWYPSGSGRPLMP